MSEDKTIVLNNIVKKIIPKIINDYLTTDLSKYLEKIQFITKDLVRKDITYSYKKNIFNTYEPTFIDEIAYLHLNFKYLEEWFNYNGIKNKKSIFLKKLSETNVISRYVNVLILDHVLDTRF